MIDHPKKTDSPAPDNVPKEKKIIYVKIKKRTFYLLSCKHGPCIFQLHVTKSSMHPEDDLFHSFGEYMGVAICKCSDNNRELADAAKFT